MPPVRDRAAPARFGVIVYDGVEPIDIGGTIGVLSMARRLLPNLEGVTLAARAGRVTLAGGLVIEAPLALAEAPPCDVVVVCGGPGWPEASRDPRVTAYLAARAPEETASVCTGALILAAAGSLDGRRATTRRASAGNEAVAPLDLLARSASGVRAEAAAVIDDGVVTGGGVSLAIDATLYLIGRVYGEAARDEVAALIEYDRAFAANRAALGIRVAA